MDYAEYFYGYLAFFLSFKTAATTTTTATPIVAKNYHCIQIGVSGGGVS